MKRGYMDWKKDLLPNETIKLRQSEFIKGFLQKNIDAAVIYADVFAADEMQYLTNLGPYWSNASAIIFKDGRVRLVTGLSARVNPWIIGLTGVESGDIVSAGPNLHIKIAEVLNEELGGRGTIGLTGQYFPQIIAGVLEEKGFKTVAYQEARDSQLVSRDDAYIRTIKEGIGLMKGAIIGVMENPEIKNMTKKRVAAEIEYACRKAGAMDILLLTGDNTLNFDQPREVMAGDSPWTIYMLIQYLGEWIALARNMDGQYNKEAFATRDRAALRLTPGEEQLDWDEGGCRFKVCARILSDHLTGQGPAKTALINGQVVSFIVEDKGKGVFLEDIYQVSPQGGLLLTSF